MAAVSQVGVFATLRQLLPHLLSSWLLEKGEWTECLCCLWAWYMKWDRLSIEGLDFGDGEQTEERMHRKSPGREDGMVQQT